jgi:hypothetical protein
MRWFKKRVVPLSLGQERRAGRIADGVLKGQRKAADYLNVLVSGMSRRRLRWLLVLFCLVFGGYCLYLLIRVFN